MSNLYGKVEEVEHRRLIARRKTVQRVVVIALSSILLVGIVVAAVAGTQNSSSKGNESKESSEQLSSSIKAVCNVTLYPDSCFTSLSPEAQSGKPTDLFKLSMQVAKNALQRASEHFKEPFWQSVLENNNMTRSAVENCKTLLELALDHVNDSLDVASDFSFIHSLDDLKTWLSTAATSQETCFDGFEFETQEIQSKVIDLLRNSTELTSNSLAIVNFISRITSSTNLGRKLLTSENEPEWLSVGARRLMTTNLTNIYNITNITVCQDGKWNFTTISEALNSIPNKSNRTTIIYVKKGVYLENVVVDKNKWNVVMIGEGSTKTIVSGRLNVVDGTPTFSSATFSVFGKGFMARDMGFQNTAGPSKQQAVALISTADMSVFYQCRFDAYQDTLYTHSNRQFYRRCDIIGTVDFIFGNAAVVFQTCNLLPRKPNPGQSNIITAQGKTDPNMNTGTSIQGCTIKAFNDLTGVKTYLGRPWKDYSTSIIMLTSMTNIINPKGWLPWSGTTVPDTIFYAEYMNTGVGAVTTDRVKWKGLKLNMTSKAASAFTVKSFIQGDKWIPAGIAYKAGL